MFTNENTAPSTEKSLKTTPIKNVENLIRSQKITEIVNKNCSAMKYCYSKSKKM